MTDGGERELAARCVAGEPAAWVTLLERYDRRISLVLLRALGASGRAELPDLRQEVYARLLSRQGAALRTLRLERPGALPAFLCRVALRVAIDHGRAQGARPQGELAAEETLALPAPGESPEETTLRGERRLRLEAALRAAAEGAHAQRDLLILRAHFHDGLNPAEISGMGCGLSSKGVETLLRRARERIGEAIAEMGTPPQGTTKVRPAARL